MTPLVLRSELQQVYLDPKLAPSIRAYIPEVHASSKCRRALTGGSRSPIADIHDPIWCELCTTTNPELATIRWVDGRWVEQENSHA